MYRTTHDNGGNDIGGACVKLSASSDFAPPHAGTSPACAGAYVPVVSGLHRPWAG